MTAPVPPAPLPPGRIVLVRERGELFVRDSGALGLLPVAARRWLLTASRAPRGPQRDWPAAELSRGSSVDLAEAGRELSRFDARPWIAGLRDVPRAVIVTTRDSAVLPYKQRRLARVLGARTYAVRGDHFAVALRREAYARARLDALAGVAGQATSLRDTTSAVTPARPAVSAVSETAATPGDVLPPMSSSELSSPNGM